MAKVQKVGAVVGWIISIVWIVFLILLIINYAHESAFVQVIHTILLPFSDVDLNICKYFGIAFCVLNFVATQIWRHGIQKNKKHFTLWSMIWFSIILSFLLICNLFFVRTDQQKDHPEMLVILIVSIVFFGHLYIISYASFRTIREKIHRLPIFEGQSDSSYSIPLRNLRESNSMQTTILSDYGYRSDEGDVEAPMFSISPPSMAPLEDSFKLNQPLKSFQCEISEENRRLNDTQNCHNVRGYEPYQRVELSDCKLSMEDPKSSVSQTYSHYSHDKSHNTPDDIHTSPSHQTSSSYVTPLQNSHETSHSNYDTHTSTHQDTSCSSHSDAPTTTENVNSAPSDN